MEEHTGNLSTQTHAEAWLGGTASSSHGRCQVGPGGGSFFKHPFWCLFSLWKLGTSQARSEHPP